jgi:hypothetical protein
MGEELVVFFLALFFAGLSLFYVGLSSLLRRQWGKEAPRAGKLNIDIFLLSGSVEKGKIGVFTFSVSLNDYHTRQNLVLSKRSVFQQA